MNRVNVRTLKSSGSSSVKTANQFKPKKKYFNGVPAAPFNTSRVKSNDEEVEAVSSDFSYRSNVSQEKNLQAQNKTEITIKDLCEDDKTRIAVLVEEFAKQTDENEVLQFKIKECDKENEWKNQQMQQINEELKEKSARIKEWESKGLLFEKLEEERTKKYNEVKKALQKENSTLRSHIKQLEKTFYSLSVYCQKIKHFERNINALEKDKSLLEKKLVKHQEKLLEAHTFIQKLNEELNSLKKSPSNVTNTSTQTISEEIISHSDVHVINKLKSAEYKKEETLLTELFFPNPSSVGSMFILQNCNKGKQIDDELLEIWSSPKNSRSSKFS